MRKITNLLVCLVLAVMASTMSVEADNYWKIRVIAVNPEGGGSGQVFTCAYSEKYSVTKTWSTDYTSGVKSSSGNPDFMLYAQCGTDVEFAGWYKDEDCTDFLSGSGEYNCWSSYAAFVSLSTSEADAPTTPVYAKFNKVAVDWSTLAEAPTSGNYYLLGVGYNGLAGLNQLSDGKVVCGNKDPNQAVLFTLTGGTSAVISCVDGGQTKYVDKNGQYLKDEPAPAKTIESMGDGTYMVNHNNGHSSGYTYWEMESSGRCDFEKKDATTSYQRWMFISEATYNNLVSVESLKETGSITINSAPTASGTTNVKFNVSDIGPVAAFDCAITAGDDGNFVLGTPTRKDNVITVPVTYTAHNVHSGTSTPLTTATVTLTAKNEAASSASGQVPVYVDLQPKFGLNVTELDWSYDGETLVETYYAGMEVAASQRARLRDKLIKDDAQTTGVAANFATWTATIIGDDADQFKFANGTRIVSGAYSADLLDVIFAPTKTSEASVATLHIVTTYTDANSNTQTDTHDIALKGKSLDVSYIQFAANGNEVASDNENYSYGDIIGTNTQTVTAELGIHGVSGLTKTWSDPAGVFEFDVNSIDFSKTNQTLTIRAHRETPVATATNHTATLTISGTGSEGTVTAVLTLTYQALPLLTPEVTWNWAELKEYATATNPISTNSDCPTSDWVITKTAGDKVTYDAIARTATVPYLHHEPGLTATFNVSFPRTDTYAAFEQTYESAITHNETDVYIDSQEKFDEYVSYKSTSSTTWLNYNSEKNAIYLGAEWVGLTFSGQTVLSFVAEAYYNYTWIIDEYYADGTSHRIFEAKLADGYHEFSISPDAVQVRIYCWDYIKDIHYFEPDYIRTDIDRVILVSDVETIYNADIVASLAKQQVTASLNSVAAEYFELRSEGKTPGSSIVFNDADGLAPYVQTSKVVTVALKENADVTEAVAATAGDACWVTFGDNYTYNHYELNVYIELKEAYDVRYKSHAHGSYTVTYEDDAVAHSVSSADYVKHMTSVAPEHTTVTISAPTPEAGYQFQGWKINGTLASLKASITKMFDETTTIEPIFGEVEGAFKIDDAYFDDLTEALSVAGSIADQEPVVTLMKDTVLNDPATYTIPAGVSLFVPYKANNYELQTIPEHVVINSDALEQVIFAYRTLTLKEGVNIVVNGNLCVGGKIASGNGGRKSAYVSGECGVINMVQGGHVEVNNGGTLYCWGFIKGQDMDQGNNTQGTGTVTANAGATIWEDFEMGDFRGGTATLEMYSASSKMLFPFQSYSVQNIEIPTTYKYGSVLRCYLTFSGSFGNPGFAVAIVGPEQTLFLLTDEESVIRKWYDPTTDLSCYELSGTAKLASLIIPTPFGDFNSAEFNLPISNSMHVLLSDCNMTLTTPLTIQAGAVLEIKNTATVNLEAKIHLFDVDEWGKYIHNYYFRSFKNLTSHKNRGAEDSKAGLDDAKFIIDGTLNVKAGKGYIYSTTGGANLMGNGGGVVNFEGALPTAGTLWQVNVLGSSPYITWVENPEAAANLRNEDGTYTRSIGGAKFYNVNGRWFHEEDKDPNPDDHTYWFTYLGNGNTGEDVGTNAVYSHDKTGLEAREKWYNVDADENCADWWIGQVDGNHYNYTYLSAWHQFMATETPSVFSGSNNKLYAQDECSWSEMGEVDENCLFTFIENEQEVKKALVDGHFIPLESNGYDPAYHAVANAEQYYICFSGCNWHEATPYTGELKTYTIVEDAKELIYIWFNNDWLNVEREEPFFYTADEVTNVKTFYEYVNGEWKVATPYVSVTDAAETRTFYSLNEAFNVASIKKDATITILRDLPNITTSLLFSTQNTTCTLDLNGHMVAGAINKLVNINASGSTFTIKSSEPGGKLRMTGKPNNACFYNVYITAGSLVLEDNATIEVENAATYVGENYALCAVGVPANTTFTMNGGAISARVDRRAYGIISNGTTTLEGGTITCQTLTKAYPYGVQVKAGTTTIKSGVTITCTAGTTYAHPVMQTGGTLTVTGGTFRAYAPSTSNASYQNSAIRVDAGTANISNAILYAEVTGTGGNSRNAYGVYSKGTTTLTNCNASAITKSTAAYGVCVAGGTTTIVSGCYTGSATSSVAGAYKSAGTLSIQGGYYSHNTNLAANLAANRGVFATTDAEKATYGSNANYKVLEAYTIAFMNGESQLQSSAQAKGTIPSYNGAEPTKAATELATYAFDGWSLTNDGDLLGSLPTVTAAATYYAHFTVLEGKYKVTFDATTNGGTTDIANSYIVEGEAVGTLPTATKTGYTFNGWFTEATGGEEITSATIPTESVTYYAQFTVNTYTLTWNLEGGKVSTAGTAAPKDATGTCSADIAYGTAITVPVVAKTGYTFLGWNTTPVSSMPAADATYTASWTAKTNTAYKVLHKLQNPANLAEYITDATENLTGTTGAYVSPAPKTTYVGYEVPAAVGPTQILADGSLEIVYLYDLITYNIIWDANGGSCATASTDVKYGATLTLPVATRDGFELDGWFTKAVGGDQISASTEILRNIGTLYAHWTEIRVVMPDVVAENGESITIDEAYITTQGTNEVTNLIIEDGGKVTVTANIEVDNLYLEGADATSGQLIAEAGVVTATNAYYDHIFNETVRHWRAFGVPWMVNLDATPIKEVKNQDGDPVNRTLVLGRDYDIIYYNGAKRASQGAGTHCWEWVKDGSHILQPGKCYMIAFNSNVGTLRFAKSYGAPVVFNGTMNVAANTASDAANSGINAIANPMTYHTTMDAGPTTAQVHNGGLIGEDDYILYNIEDKKFVVGKAVYVQVDAAQPVVINAADGGTGVISPAAAPKRRAQVATDKRYLSLDDYYSVAIQGTNENSAAKVYVLPEEDKNDEYVIGHDLAKMGMSATRSQIWVKKYGVNLCMHTTAPVDDVTEFTVNLYAPSAGEYTITNIQSPDDNYTVYLTRDGEAIWNLSNGAYTLTLNKGIVTNYGLRISAKTPAIFTGMDEAIIDAQGQTRKVMINNQIFILRGDKVYSIDGQLVR